MSSSIRQRATPDAREPAAVSGPTAALVITTYNHAHFLGEALASATAQRRAFDEIVVVDDGSTDDPARVVASFPGVRLIAQANQGLAAARNTGLNATRADFIAFLDADDRLLPAALARGLAAFAANPGCSFVYGGHRRVDDTGAALGTDRYSAIGPDAFAALLGGNPVAMHATVLYRRAALVAAGGFDPALRRCEDYDVYLRLAREGDVHSYGEAVAEYRWHDGNMSHNHAAMLATVLAVHGRQRDAARRDPATAAAWHAGRRAWRDYYADEALRAARVQPGSTTARTLMASARLSPGSTLRRVARAGRRRLRATLSPRVARLLLGKRVPPPVGRVNFGDFGRPVPISLDFGFDRGLPVDRYYIEKFLTARADVVRGRVLEIGDDEYSRRFGGVRIDRQDILHVHAGNPRATIIGDLGQPGVLPDDAFDCIVLTQTLHLIYDMAGAVRRVRAALKPGGSLLLTVPGISQIDRGEWGDSWFWSLTPAGLGRVLAEAFAADEVAIEAHGNVLAATAFLQGLAWTEVGAARLDVRDSAYPVIVAARARRSPA